MKKILLILLVLAGGQLGLSVYENGWEGALDRMTGGLDTAPIASRSRAVSPTTTQQRPDPDTSHRVPLAHGMRDRANAAMGRAAR